MRQYHLPSEPLRDEFIDEFLVAHVNKKNEIIAFTIENIEAFLESTKEKEYLKQRARENVEAIVKNVKSLTRILPNQVISKLHICIP